MNEWHVFVEGSTHYQKNYVGQHDIDLNIYLNKQTFDHVIYPQYMIFL